MSTEQRTVAVTGATGFVGRHVVRELAGRGWRVRGLTRSAEKSDRVLPAGVEVVEGDVTDRLVVDRLLSGADAVIHLVGIIRERPGGQTFHRMHVQATRTIVEATLDAGIRRYLHMSAFGVSDEGRCAYLRTKWEAETVVRRSRLDWTIFRPGLIHGPGGEFTELIMGWARGKGPMSMMPFFKRAVVEEEVPFGMTRYEEPTVAPVFVEDVAACFADALRDERTIGEVYHLTGSEALPMRRMYSIVRESTPGAAETVRIVAIPADMAAQGARMATLLGLGQLLPFDAGMAIMGGEDAFGCSTKAERAFGRTLRPFTETFRSYAS